MKNLIIFLIFAFSVISKAITITWTGAVSNSWHDASNWSPNQIPTINDDVVFSNSTKSCTVTVDVIVNSITTLPYSAAIVNSEYNTIFLRNITLNTNGTSNNFMNYGIIECFGTATGTTDPRVLSNSASFKSGTYSLGRLIMRNTNEFSINILNNMFSPVSKLNYVRIDIPQRPINDINLLATMSPNSVITQFIYVDAAGRATEKIIKQGAPNKEDIVKIYDYDEYGRQTKKYLPFTTNNFNGNSNANLKFQKQLDYYVNNTDLSIPQLGSTTATNSYTEFEFDKHYPYEVNKTALPGNSWALNTGKNQINSNYLNSNTILRWFVDELGNTSANIAAGQRYYYPTGTLNVNISVNEDGEKVTTYTDKNNLTVCMRVATSNLSTEDLITYYVYDEFDRLRCIVPPLANKNMPVDYYIDYTSTFAKKYLYFYFYDERGNIIKERQPQQDEKIMIYDKLNRLVLSSNNQKSGSVATDYLFYKYDVFNRKVYTGTYSNLATVSTIKTTINNQTNLHEKEATTITTSNYIEGYTNSVFPVVLNSDTKIVYYYDDYETTTTYLGAAISSTANTNARTNRISGRLAGKLVKNLTTSDTYKTKYFYDINGNILQKNETSTLDQTQTDRTIPLLDFNNKVIKHMTSIFNQGATSTNLYKSNYIHEYDHMGRITSIYHNLNGTISTVDKLLANYKYNKLGQLIERNLHSEDIGASYLQSVDYRYNIHGRLSSINNASLTNDMSLTTIACGASKIKTNNDNNDLFGLELFYNDNLILNGLSQNGCGSNNTQRFDGKISAVYWQTKNPNGVMNVPRAYLHTYDKVGRLTTSLHLLRDNTSLYLSKNILKEDNITYDANGNILKLKRTDASGILVDDLTYTYDGNQLASVADIADKTKGFIDGIIATTAEYTYDRWGNMTLDNNKNLLLTYNELGLVNQMTKSLDGTPFLARNIPNMKVKEIYFTYDAEGRLIKRSEQDKQYTNSVATPITVEAVTQFANGGYVKMQGNEYITHPEGRIEISGGTNFNYVYHIKDHLEHVRVTFDKNPSTGLAQLRQEENFTPFGVRNTYYTLGTGTNFIFSDKEWQDGPVLVNFGWRQYDPMLGRWHNPDKLAVLFHNTSPYAFINNDPVNNMEYDGLSGGPGVNGGGGYNNGNGYTGSFSGGFSGGPLNIGSTSGGPGPSINSKYSSSSSSSNDASWDTQKYHNGVKEYTSSHTGETTQLRGASNPENSYSYSNSGNYQSGGGGNNNYGNSSYGSELSNVLASTKDDYTFDNDQSTSIEEKTTYIQNNSNYDIYFKPEDTMIINGQEYSYKKAYRLGPGQSWYYPVDGVKTPRTSINKVHKLPDGFSVTIDKEGNADIDNFPDSMYYYGEVELPDDSWQSLMDAYKK